LAGCNSERINEIGLRSYRKNGPVFSTHGVLGELAIQDLLLLLLLLLLSLLSSLLLQIAKKQRRQLLHFTSNVLEVRLIFSFRLIVHADDVIY